MDNFNSTHMVCLMVGVTMGLAVTVMNNNYAIEKKNKKKKLKLERTVEHIKTHLCLSHAVQRAQLEVFYEFRNKKLGKHYDFAIPAASVLRPRSPERHPFMVMLPDNADDNSNPTKCKTTKTVKQQPTKQQQHKDLSNKTKDNNNNNVSESKVMAVTTTTTKLSQEPHTEHQDLSNNIINDDNNQTKEQSSSKVTNENNDASTSESKVMATTTTLSQEPHTEPQDTKSRDNKQLKGIDDDKITSSFSKAIAATPPKVDITTVANSQAKIPIELKNEWENSITTEHSKSSSASSWINSIKSIVYQKVLKAENEGQPSDNSTTSLVLSNIMDDTESVECSSTSTESANPEDLEEIVNSPKTTSLESGKKSDIEALLKSYDDVVTFDDTPSSDSDSSTASAESVSLSSSECKAFAEMVKQEESFMSDNNHAVKMAKIKLVEAFQNQSPANPLDKQIQKDIKEILSSNTKEPQKSNNKNNNSMYHHLQVDQDSTSRRAANYSSRAGLDRVSPSTRYYY